MTSSIAGLSLKEPEQQDWDKVNKAKTYTPPPPALTADGKAIVYKGILPKAFIFEADKEGLLQIVIDPITVADGPCAGQTFRFTRAGVASFKKGGNKVGTLLRSAGSKATPQTNEQYATAINSIAGKATYFTSDWEAYNKDTGESVKGFNAFPVDPDRPGMRKSILKQGELYNVLDDKGNVIGTNTVQSEVLFANARVKFFVEPKVVQSAGQ